VNAPVATETAAPAANNAYISQNPVKQETREQFEKDEKPHRPNQNQKKRKHKEQLEQHAHAHEQQNQVHEEVVQLSRQEQRQEQRELKRQQKRQQSQEPQNQQQHHDAAQGNENAPLPRRDRNQQRPNRPNRHRDQSVLNEAPAATTAAPANPQQVKVDVVDAPRSEPMNTALIVNIDQGQSEIVALNPQQATAPKAKAEVAPAVVEKAETKPAAQAEPVVAKEAPAATVEEAVQAPVKRASNDPRSRRRQRGAQAPQKAAAPKVAPSQIPALGQYTLGSLIRHVYGEDCTILIEQFGLITTFNRALQKFAEQYASTLVVETVVEEEKRPVTRDAELPSKQVTEEAEPAPVLALTPPEASTVRVANDPRERRRLAKLAAEQAKEAHIASNTTPAPVENTESKEEVKTEEAVTPVEETVVAAPEQQPLELATETVAAPAETAPVEAVEAPVAKAEAKSEVTTKVAEKAQAAEKAEQAAAAAEAESEDEAAKAEKEKSSRPRRPRGRPPKKAAASNE